MSFSISIAGHKNTKDGLESATLEAQIKDKAEALVDEIKTLVGEDGTVTATGTFGNIGQHDLVARKSSTAETPQKETPSGTAEGSRGPRPAARRSEGEPGSS